MPLQHLPNENFNTNADRLQEKVDVLKTLITQKIINQLTSNYKITADEIMFLIVIGLILNSEVIFKSNNL